MESGLYHRGDLMLCRRFMKNNYLNNYNYIYIQLNKHKITYRKIIISLGLVIH